MSNFGRSSNLPLINCEIEPDFSWSNKCIISKISITPAATRNPNATPPVHDVATMQNSNLPVPEVAAIQITGVIFQINNGKLYVPVVTLSINDNIKILENIKQGFKRTISWNKYRFEITTQPKSNNLDHLTDPTFRNINKLFVLSFKYSNDDPTRNSCDEYYMWLVDIKDFNPLIDKKPFFDQPVQNKEEAYQKLMTTQQEIYYNFHIIKIIIKPLV